MPERMVEANTIEMEEEEVVITPTPTLQEPSP